MSGTPSVKHRQIELGEGETIDVVEVSGAPSASVVSVLAGVHGDEEEGVLAVRQLARLLGERTDLKGRVRFVPVCSPSSYRANTRLSSVDGKNMARVFPGDEGGTLTERAAHAITEEIIRGSDVLIDLHSAGLNYAMPLFCGFFDRGDALGRESLELARSFGVSVVWAHTTPTRGRTISAALELEIPAIYVEASGGGQVRAADVDALVNGVCNVLAHQGMLGASNRGTPAQVLIRDSGGDIDNSPSAPAAGILVTHVQPGDRVEKGQVIAQVFDSLGGELGVVTAPRYGLVMCLRRTPRIDRGETVAMVGRLPGHVLSE